MCSCNVVEQCQKGNTQNCHKGCHTDVLPDHYAVHLVLLHLATASISGVGNGAMTSSVMDGAVGFCRRTASSLRRTAQTMRGSNRAVGGLSKCATRENRSATSGSEASSWLIRSMYQFVRRVTQ